MESNKQEKYDLMHDNPVAKDASGGRDGSWMSKHSKSQMGSPLHGKVTMTKTKAKKKPKLKNTITKNIKKKPVKVPYHPLGL
jgi:hypothetical protein